MKKIILLAVFLAVLGGLGLALRSGLVSRERSAPLVLYGNVDIRTVNLSFRVPGRLESLLVDEGDAVVPGQILGRLEKTPQENAVQEALAALAARKANLAQMEAGYRKEEIARAKALVDERAVSYTYAERFYRRQQGLLGKKAVSADAVDAAASRMREAGAALASARESLAQYAAGYRPEEIAMARAELMQAEAAHAQAALNLADTALLSPSAGTILTRAVEPGAMLASGSTVFTLSLTRPVWIRAYVDEPNLGRAVPGSTVMIYTDGRPERPYTGSIGFVSPTAEFTPKTVQTPELRTDLVYRLRIVVSDPDEALRQGMPVTVRFPAEPGPAVGS